MKKIVRTAVLHKIKLFVFLILFGSAAFCAQAPDDGKRTVKIGILAFRPKAETVENWQPFADYLNTKIPKYKFVVKAYNLPEIDEVVRAKEVDFMFTNPEQYVVLQHRYELSSIGSLIRITKDGQEINKFGGVIFTKKSNVNINKISDLKGKKIATVGVDSLGSYMMQVGVMLDAGVDPREKSSFLFTGMPQDKVVYSVIKGEADAGFVRTELLEAMDKSKKINLSDIKIINQLWHGSFPYLVSTPLYPEWPLAVLQGVPTELTNEVIMAILQTNLQNPIHTKSGKICWGIRGSYEPVRQLLQKLNYYPYNIKRPVQLKDVIEKYYHTILISILLLVVASVLARKIYKQNKLLKREIESKSILQAELQYFNDKLISTLNGIDIVLYVINPATFEVVFINEYTKKVFGDVTGRKCYKAIQNQESQCDFCPLFGKINENLPVGMRYSWTNKNAMNDRWYAINAHIIEWPDGQKVVLQVATDITEQKGLELGLKELNQTLEDRVEEEIKKRRDQEHILFHQSKMATMGEMIGAIAHQWRQPLNALNIIIQDVEMAYEYGELDKEYLNDFIKKSTSQISFMSKTIDDFRHFFKVDKGKVVFDIAAQTRESIKLVEAQFISRSIEIIYDMKESVLVSGYPSEFSQVILNIVSNAKDVLIEREVKNPIITISCAVLNNEAAISIADNGGGIPDDVINRVFEPYFTTKDADKGTGIGLYMSKMIMESHMSGTIEVKNTELGAMFTVRMPIYAPESVSG